MSSKKGITLVALVITIVVLLILAGVSITSISGNNGVVTKATDAKTETDKAEAREELEQAIGAAQADFSQYWMNNVGSTFLNSVNTTASGINLKSNSYEIKYPTDATSHKGTIQKKNDAGTFGTKYEFELEAIEGSNMGAKIKSFKVAND